MNRLNDHEYVLLVKGRSPIPLSLLEIILDPAETAVVDYSEAGEPSLKPEFAELTALTGIAQVLRQRANELPVESSELSRLGYHDDAQKRTVEARMAAIYARWMDEVAAQDRPIEIREVPTEIIRQDILMPHPTF